MFQFVEAGGPPGLFYSPGRDLAHCGLPYIGYAISEMAAQLKDPGSPIYSLLDMFGVSKDELEDSLDCFVKSLEEECKSGRPEPLETNAFGHVRVQVRAVIYLYIAPVFIGSAIRGYKDVHSDKVIKELDEKEFRTKALKYIQAFGSEREGS